MSTEHTNSPGTLEVLLVEPGQHPKVTTIGSDLDSLQEAVGGFIEAGYFFEDPVALVCWEEGKLCGAPLNRAVRDEDGEIIDIVAGNFFICGLGEENFASLPRPLQEKYEAMFHQPEIFLRLGRAIIALPTDPEPAPETRSAPQRPQELQHGR